MAGILFQSGFDHYTTLTQRFNAVQEFNGGVASITSNGRNSTNGFRAFSSASAIGNGVSRVQKTLGSNASTIYMAFAFRTDALPTSTTATEIAEVSDLGTNQCDLRIIPGGLLRVTRNGTVLATSSASLLTNIYYHIEWKIVIDNSAGSTIVKVNEVEVINSTSLDTQNTANAYATDVYLGFWNAFPGVVRGDFDDFVVRDDGFSGDCSVVALLPTGIGSTNQWTATGAATTREAVDETPPNSDTDYIQTANITDLSLFTYPTISVLATIVAVIPIPFAKKTAAGVTQIKSVVRSGGANYAGVAKSPSDGSYEFHPDILMVNPATGVAFTAAEWNAIEVGVQRNA